MFSSQSADISLGAPCRTLAAVRADRTENRFVIGTASPHGSNHLHVVRFHSDVNELSVDAGLAHDAGPVGALCCSPIDPALVLTAEEHGSAAVLWKIPRSARRDFYDASETEDADASQGTESSAAMERVASLDPGRAGGIVSIVWRDSSEDVSAQQGDVLTLDMNGVLTQWDMLSPTSPEAVRTVETALVGVTPVPGVPPRAAWDPHANGDAVAVTHGSSVSILDWRADTSVPSGTVETFRCHRYGVTDLDYNPNKPYTLATSGQDGLVKIWDLRSAKHPLLVARGGHSHWVWSVRYNPFHDQLVLSTGTDCVANLWRLSTVSSAPLLTEEYGNNNNNSSETSAPNVRVARHEHNDSVYAASWGAADAWIYLTVGYDGKAILSHVPSKEKYKILL
jgi:hypothetical protein